ncbi:hypothetical protein HK101_009930, partial [Irineochytrium annulatum]
MLSHREVAQEHHIHQPFPPEDGGPVCLYTHTVNKSGVLSGSIWIKNICFEKRVDLLLHHPFDAVVIPASYGKTFDEHYEIWNFREESLQKEALFEASFDVRFRTGDGGEYYDHAGYKILENQPHQQPVQAITTTPAKGKAAFMVDDDSEYSESAEADSVTAEPHESTTTEPESTTAESPAVTVENDKPAHTYGDEAINVEQFKSTVLAESKPELVENFKPEEVKRDEGVDVEADRGFEQLVAAVPEVTDSTSAALPNGDAPENTLLKKMSGMFGSAVGALSGMSERAVDALADMAEKVEDTIEHVATKVVEETRNVMGELDEEMRKNGHDATVEPDVERRDEGVDVEADRGFEQLVAAVPDADDSAPIALNGDADVDVMKEGAQQTAGNPVEELVEMPEKSEMVEEDGEEEKLLEEMGNNVGEMGEILQQDEKKDLNKPNSEVRDVEDLLKQEEKKETEEVPEVVMADEAIVPFTVEHLAPAAEADRAMPEEESESTDEKVPAEREAPELADIVALRQVEAMPLRLEKAPIDVHISHAPMSPLAAVAPELVAIPALKDLEVVSDLAPIVEAEPEQAPEEAQLAQVEKESVEALAPELADIPALKDIELAPAPVEEAPIVKAEVEKAAVEVDGSKKVEEAPVENEPVHVDEAPVETVVDKLANGLALKNFEDAPAQSEEAPIVDAEPEKAVAEPEHNEKAPNENEPAHSPVKDVVPELANVPALKSVEVAPAPAEEAPIVKTEAKQTPADAEAETEKAPVEAVALELADVPAPKKVEFAVPSKPRKASFSSEVAAPVQSGAGLVRALTNKQKKEKEKQERRAKAIEAKLEAEGRLKRNTEPKVPGSKFDA